MGKEKPGKGFLLGKHKIHPINYKLLIILKP